MIPGLGGHALRALTPGAAVTVDPSLCVRHRCHRNDCRKCFEVCRPGAIRWEGQQGLTIDTQRCTQCLLCLAVCPTAALQSPELFLPQLLDELRQSPRPVLGCRRHADAPAHARLSCLGYLAHPELQVLLALELGNGVQVDLCRCQACPNGQVVDRIRAAYRRLSALLPEHRVELVFDAGLLDYRPPLVSRRQLFGFIGKRSAQTAAVVVGRLQEEPEVFSYGGKQISVLRGALIKALAALPIPRQRELLAGLGGGVVFTSACTACGACAAVCPTGAVETGGAVGAGPLFHPRRCVACGSCAAFCRRQGVSLNLPQTAREPHNGQ